MKLSSRNEQLCGSNNFSLTTCSIVGTSVEVPLLCLSFSHISIVHVLPVHMYNVDNQDMEESKSNYINACTFCKNTNIQFK